ncbi:MAG: hypothetical protein JJ975_11865 [Bacteroidia bacterium]|nr:hypothetical protein [Bacteroidia bacterium]
MPATVLIFSACGPDPEPVVTNAGNYYVRDVISHTYKEGVDPCPNEFPSTMKINCTNDGPNAACKADSVAITGHTNGLDVWFTDTNKKSTSFGSSHTVEAVLRHTCAIKESFDHTYTVVLYRDGKEVGSQDVKVSVTAR